MLIKLEKEDFNEVIKKDLVIVDFYADWCGPCKMLSPVLEDIAHSYDVVKVNVDNHDDIARKYGIMSIPTVIIFEKGNIKKKLVGFMSKEKLLDEINN